MDGARTPLKGMEAFNGPITLLFHPNFSPNKRRSMIMVGESIINIQQMGIKLKEKTDLP